MGFYYKGRYLGETAREAVNNLEDEESVDVAYGYIVGYFDITDVAETIATDRVCSKDWIIDAMESLRGYEEADCPGEIAGLTYRKASKPAASKCVKRTGTARKAPAKKPATRRRTA